MITRLGLAPRRRGVSFAEFQRHWREEHAAVASAIPNLRGYVQNHAILDGNGRPLLPYAGFDACAETSFDDLASMDAGFASPLYQQAVRADEEQLIDKSRFFLLLCDRVVLRDVPAATESVKLLTFFRVHPLVSRPELVELLQGDYAELAAQAGAARHEQLVPSVAGHEGRMPPACDVVDLLWFDDVPAALDYVNGAAGAEAEWQLAGKAFGRERLLATVRVVRELPAEHNQGVAA